MNKNPLSALLFSAMLTGLSLPALAETDSTGPTVPGSTSPTPAEVPGNTSPNGTDTGTFTPGSPTDTSPGTDNGLGND
ncbi:MAG: hypothetical protein ACRESP_22015, partial [Pseudomonas sp.]